MKKFLSIVTVFLWSMTSVFGTHNRAGEITYEHINGLSFRFTLVTYTKDSAPADRPELTVFWGDGNSSVLSRSNGGGNGQPIGNDIQRNIYIGEYTYPAPGTYTVTMEDPNRNANVQNIPNSVQIPFAISTTLVINPNLGFNNAPDLLYPPIDNGCVNVPFVHNPTAFDQDGDSLSYSLIPCAGQNGQPIPLWTLPSASSSIAIDAVTGDFLWDSPVTAGEYNIAIQITEHRKDGNGNWTVVGRMVRDMQIDIAGCNNNPPEIDPLDDVCVEAGDVVSFPVTATDPDANVVSLSAFGGPFELPDSAFFPQDIQGQGTVTGTFSWQTTCAHVQLQPYQVVFRAEDSGVFPQLVDIETMYILVVGPAPENVIATPVSNTIDLSWDISVCTEVVGYDVYRKNQFYGFVPDECETGVPGYTGYSKIASLNGLNSNSYLDDNNGLGLPKGNSYCYMIVARFPDGAESYASAEVCAELPRDQPIITNVSVLSTEVSAGSIDVRWVKPLEIDSVQYPGPYAYKVYRAEGTNGTTYTELSTLSGINDTDFVDTGLNTQNIAYRYRIDFLQDDGTSTTLISESDPASSVFINLVPTDQAIIVNWTINVPWINEEFIIYRQDPGAATFDSVGVSFSNNYLDSGLENNKVYCYYVETVGAYSGSSIPSPLLNLSQENCEAPNDTTPPCPPILRVEKSCDQNFNQLNWGFPDDLCGIDAIEYQVYYTPVEGEEFELLVTIGDPADSSYTHENLSSVAGCYAVVAVDSFLNVSEFSNVVCVDNCPEYELPNVFTPNGDGNNELVIPISNKYVESVEMTIYNRWGAIVYETNDININWDGTNYRSGQPVPEGVYYYVCKVNEVRLSGLEQRELTGFIQLFRN